jgi:hypothetical protein
MLLKMAVVEDFNVAVSIVRLRYKFLVFSCVNLEFNSKITQIIRNGRKTLNTAETNPKILKEFWI